VVGANRNVIMDFQDGVDHINLAGIDAINGGVDQAFNSTTRPRSRQRVSCVMR
jgi:hypothetical protein